MVDLSGKSCKESENFSAVLEGMADRMPAEGMTLREVMNRLRERGLLALCMVLTSPFLLPVSIPGSSTPFGLVIALIGLGVVAGKTPALPGRIMDRPIAAGHLAPVFRKGAWLFGRIERVTRPRLPLLTCNRAVSRINGLVMVASAVMLMFPLPLPLSNTFPAYGVLLLAAGTLEDDGCLVALGYLMAALTVIYFTALALLGAAGINAIFFR